MGVLGESSALPWAFRFVLARGGGGGGEEGGWGRRWGKKGEEGGRRGDGGRSESPTIYQVYKRLLCGGGVRRGPRIHSSGARPFWCVVSFSSGLRGLFLFFKQSDVAPTETEPALKHSFDASIFNLTPPHPPHPSPPRGLGDG